MIRWTSVAACCVGLCAGGNAWVDSVSAETSPLGDDEGRPIVSWEHAATVVGQTARVVGKVVKVGHAGRVHFLDFHATRRDVFKVVLFREALPLFAGSLESLYSHQWVQVHGAVTRYAGVPQIVVRDPAQITVLQTPPTLPPPAAEPAPRTGVWRIATFNVENLFDAVDDPYTQDEGTPAKPRRELEQVAQCMLIVDADVWALQEVENRGYLRRFTEVFLSHRGYREIVLIEGNDGRGIDVALLSRLPVGAVTTQQHLRFDGPDGQQHRFQRDVLQVRLHPPQEAPFEVWVVHLKSNSDGRETAERIRLAETQALRRLYDQRLQQEPQAGIMICGDFNDTWDHASLAPLRAAPQAPVTFFDTVPSDQRITYNRPPYRSMIDYIVTSPALAQRVIAGSYRIHRGCGDEQGSDHNPVSLEITR